MKSVKWFSLGFGAMFGATLGVLATAAPGDLIYQHHTGKQQITGAQAVCFATCARNAGVTDIKNEDLISVCAQRDETTSTGFSAHVVGLKSSPPAQLPTGAHGVNVVGLVE